MVSFSRRRNLVMMIGLASLGLSVGVGSLSGQGSAGKETKKPGSVTSQAIGASKDDLAVAALARAAERKAIRKIVDAGKQRLDAQRRFYEQGRITIDRYLDASAQLMAWETQLATNRAERVAVVERHLERVRNVEAREIIELDAGRSTPADLSEAKLATDKAELDLIRVSTLDVPDVRELEKRIQVLEQKLEKALKALETKDVIFR